MEKKKQNSCLGLFFKGSILCGLILALLSTLCVIIAIKLFGADPAVWTDFSHFSNRPWLVIYAITALSMGLGTFLSLATVAVSALFGGGKKGASSGSSKPRSRPQSNRKTTI